MSMGEFGATSLIKRPEWPTMPVIIFEYLARPGISNYGRALAMSVILMVVTGIGFMIIPSIRSKLVTSPTQTKILIFILDFSEQHPFLKMN